MATKNDPNKFSDFFENFSSCHGRNCRFDTEGHYQFFRNLHSEFFV